MSGFDGHTWHCDTCGAQSTQCYRCSECGADLAAKNSPKTAREESR